jgi:hypothetical protein
MKINTLTRLHNHLNFRYFISKRESAFYFVFMITLFLAWTLLLSNPDNLRDSFTQTNSNSLLSSLFGVDQQKLWLNSVIFIIVQLLSHNTYSRRIADISPMVHHMPISNYELNKSWIIFIQLKMAIINLISSIFLIIGTNLLFTVAFVFVAQIVAFFIARSKNNRIQTRNNAIFHSKLRLPSVISFKIQFLRLLFGSLFPILIYAVIVIVFCLIWIARFGTMSDVRFLAGNMEMNLLFLDLFFIMSVCSGADSERPWNLVRFFRAYPSTYSQWQIQYSIAAFLFFLIPRLLSLSGSAIASDNTMLLAIGLLVNTLILPLLFFPTKLQTILYVFFMAGGYFIMLSEVSSSFQILSILPWPFLFVVGVFIARRDYYSTSFDKSTIIQNRKTYDPL